MRYYPALLPGTQFRAAGWHLVRRGHFSHSLFESLANKLDDYPELKELLSGLLFTGHNLS